MSSTARNDDWKKYDKSLNKSIALEDLRDSVRLQEEEKVEKAIGRCREAGLQDNEKVREAAEVHLPVITARNKLSKSCVELKERGDDEGVKNELRSIKRDGLSSYLHMEVREAKNLLERHEKGKLAEKPKVGSMAMDTKTVAEIRRYQNPPAVLHKVIQGALLLVGEDEDTTDSWKNCQRICNPYGNDGLCRRFVNFDPSKVHPEIVARAKEILHAIEFNDVQAVGRGAPVTFYVWAMGSIEKSEAAAAKEEKKQKTDPKGTATDNKNEKTEASSDSKSKTDNKNENSEASSDSKSKTDNKNEKLEASSDSKSKTDNKNQKPEATSDSKSKTDNKNEKKQVKPANRRRQKEILGRLPLPPDSNKNFYNMTITTKNKSNAKTDPNKQTTDGKPSKPKMDGEPSKATDGKPTKPKMEDQPSKATDGKPTKPKMDDQPSNAAPDEAKAR